MQRKQKSSGFTLIELMMVVAIVGILAAVAYPAYTDSVRKSARGDAKAALTELAQFMARTYAENKTYKPGGALPTLPVTQVPEESSSKKYNLTLVDAATSSNTFRLAATPINAQASDSCGTLTLNHLGQRGAGGDVNTCW